jgi:hypothetical protein
MADGRGVRRLVMMGADYEQHQAQSHAFIDHTRFIGIATAEVDMQGDFRVSPPAVQSMVKTMERRGIFTGSRACHGRSACCCLGRNIPTWNDEKLPNPHAGRSTQARPDRAAGGES